MVQASGGDWRCEFGESFSTKYRNLKRKLQAKFPFFDKNALDSARFIFGVENSNIEIFEGTTIIDELLKAPQEKMKLRTTKNICLTMSDCDCGERR